MLKGSVSWIGIELTLDLIKYSVNIMRVVI